MARLSKILILILLLAVPTLLRAQTPLRPSPAVTVADMVIDEAMKYIGIPYRWGGKSPKGFDCAGFTRYIYNKFGLELAPSAAPQYKAGSILKNNQIKKGDLVFYAGRSGSKAIGHVGIVTSVDGNGFYFIHSATSTGITVSHSSEPYYKKRYVGACRVVDRIVSNLPANDTTKANIPVYRQFLFGDTHTLDPQIPFLVKGW